uniref:von Willebrand factor A domain containing 11 n=1 Tax=Maylandia zebra TaxID=106582 RepID=A0A3P9BWU9_9CICH
APHHFNSEAFLEGRSLITQGMVAIKANVHNENFQVARTTLGRALHTLQSQDFYSHSNWVELGYTKPYSNLINPGLPLDNLAVNTPTCSNCDSASGTCPNQLLPNILKDKKLTSGYMGVFSSVKPKKCSHGGAADRTSKINPQGGISKDERHQDNLAFHNAAVQAATDASLELLQDLRLAVGDSNFLMMGIARSSVLCFVIDTTGSMSDDIEEARSVVYQIIDAYKGTQDEPSEYILVPFNDPFGPMIRTTHVDKMKEEISKLTASGGGDEPEMCLSGLQLALTGAPSSSDIYVFTDALAKDIELKDTINALISSTKSKVSFFITTPFSRRRRSLRAASFDDYKDIALTSGGQAIHVSKSELSQATDIILDTSTSALVTVLQRARNPGTQETFPFTLDESLKNITIYITGRSITFTLTNPAVTQSQSEASGKLGTIQTVGNLHRIRFNSEKQAGNWQININS